MSIRPYHTSTEQFLPTYENTLVPSFLKPFFKRMSSVISLFSTIIKIFLSNHTRHRKPTAAAATVQTDTTQTEVEELSVTNITHKQHRGSYVSSGSIIVHCVCSHFVQSL